MKKSYQLLKNMKKLSFVLILTIITVMSNTPYAYADYPIFYQRYTADPSGLEYNGRIYLYCSHDTDGQTGYAMNDITCISSDDTKNWTDHGEVFNATTNTNWAFNSWAPSVVYRNNKFYMYYGNGAASIGVAVSDSPTGPFTDVLGKPLITGSTPGVNPTPGFWIFDPCVFVDSDGQAYMYFGGNGENNIRVIKLGNDMISTVGSAVQLYAPHFLEASYMHKYNGKYYFSYSTDWTNGAPTIDYMVSNNPMSGFQYRGTILPQPPQNGNNNHASIFSFQGNWYIAYHNRTVATQNGVDPVYQRNVCIDRLYHNSDGTIQQVAITSDGVPMPKFLYPYITNAAVTMNKESGIETEPCSEGGRDVGYIENGDWIKIKAVDLSSGATSFTARVASATNGGNIELRLNSPTGTLIGTCSVQGTGGWQSWADKTCTVNMTPGIYDLYLKFTGDSGFLFNMRSWSFTR